MRRTLTKHKTLETIGWSASYFYPMLPASSPVANLFKEVSAYIIQTNTNKYISEDSLTNHYVILHIGTQHDFNYFFRTRKKETEPAEFRTFPKLKTAVAR